MYCLAALSASVLSACWPIVAAHSCCLFVSACFPSKLKPAHFRYRPPPPSLVSVVRYVPLPCCDWKCFLPGRFPNLLPGALSLTLPNPSTISLPATGVSTPIAFVSLLAAVQLSPPLLSGLTFRPHSPRLSLANQLLPLTAPGYTNRRRSFC